MKRIEDVMKRSNMMLVASAWKWNELIYDSPSMPWDSEGSPIPRILEKNGFPAQPCDAFQRRKIKSERVKI